MHRCIRYGFVSFVKFRWETLVRVLLGRDYCVPADMYVADTGPEVDQLHVAESIRNHEYA